MHALQSLKNTVLCLFALLSFTVAAYSQKTIKSIVVYNVLPFDSVMNENYNYTLECTRQIKPLKKGKFDLRITRFRQISNSSMGKMVVDTDNPFTDSQLSKSAADHYLQFIDKPILLDTTTVDIAEKTVLSKLWLSSFPILRSSEEFSSMYLTPKLSSTGVLIDSIITKTQLIVNQYEIVQPGVVKIEGFNVPIENAMNKSGDLALSEKATDATTNNEVAVDRIPESGESIVAKSSGKKQSYSLTAFYDTSTNLISYAYGRVKKEETLNIFGTTKVTSKSQYVAVINKVD